MPPSNDLMIAFVSIFTNRVALLVVALKLSLPILAPSTKMEVPYSADISYILQNLCAESTDILASCSKFNSHASFSHGVQWYPA